MMDWGSVFSAFLSFVVFLNSYIIPTFFLFFLFFSYGCMGVFALFFSGFFFLSTE